MIERLEKITLSGEIKWVKDGFYKSFEQTFNYMKYYNDLLGDKEISLDLQPNRIETKVMDFLKSTGMKYELKKEKEESVENLNEKQLNILGQTLVLTGNIVYAAGGKSVDLLAEAAENSEEANIEHVKPVNIVDSTLNVLSIVENKRLEYYLSKMQDIVELLQVYNGKDVSDVIKDIGSAFGQFYENKKHMKNCRDETRLKTFYRNLDNVIEAVNQRTRSSYSEEIEPFVTFNDVIEPFVTGTNISTQKKDGDAKKAFSITELYNSALVKGKYSKESVQKALSKFGNLISLYKTSKLEHTTFTFVDERGNFVDYTDTFKVGNRNRDLLTVMTNIANANVNSDLVEANTRGKYASRTLKYKQINLS